MFQVVLCLRYVGRKLFGVTNKYNATFRLFSPHFTQFSTGVTKVDVFLGICCQRKGDPGQFWKVKEVGLVSTICVL